MKDNPYIVILDPVAFNEAFDEISAAYEAEKEDASPRHLKGLLNAIEAFKKADKSHDCLDEKEEPTSPTL